jgi:hypothetical protein
LLCVSIIAPPKDPEAAGMGTAGSIPPLSI